MTIESYMNPPGWRTEQGVFHREVKVKKPKTEPVVLPDWLEKKLQEIIEKGSNGKGNIQSR